MFRSILAVAVLVFSTAVTAEEPTPAYMHPEVIRAAAQINMDENQQATFRQAVTDFLQGYGSDVGRLLRANNQTNLPRKIAKRRRVRAGEMDETMQKALSEDQFPAYETYRDTLLAKMDEAADARRRGR